MTSLQKNRDPFQWPRKLIGQAVNLILPHRCIACEEILSDKNALCTNCWNQMTFIGAPLCHCCGYPFEIGEAGDNLCNSCLDRRPTFDQARAAVLYDDTSRRIILAYKHGDRTDLAPSLAQWLLRPLQSLDTPPDLVAPVPLHRWRLLQRRFNQSALLARPLSQLTGLPLEQRLVRRHRATPSQGHLTPGQRRRNVARAFSIPTRAQQKIQGKHILLVDDVLTTGATAEEIANALKQAGAARVSLIALARALRPRH
ncbi:ComF family protein [Aestuariispira insulae]|uniref:ComF family protein n=1 Tax=Aestuariispira insulae TaxID=1461337 RepID=A0A3D9HEH3_9PROT|nr:ComF family protein [Aestuariispira insulae]RED47651.1 ComF family protein [Aestuariispira insulae]